jgi:hypothetical protein
VSEMEETKMRTRESVTNKSLGTLARASFKHRGQSATKAVVWHQKSIPMSSQRGRPASLVSHGEARPANTTPPAWRRGTGQRRCPIHPPDDVHPMVVVVLRLPVGTSSWGGSDPGETETEGPVPPRSGSDRPSRTLRNLGSKTTPCGSR